MSRSLEADLPDEAVAKIGQRMIEPFRAGNYGEGISAAVEGLIARLAERRGFKMD